ncbi:MAG TPA: hypothetical protein VLD37_00200 [Candidatus Bilamarchaeum sp.]|nr:hypothetical protein [Candidatus Bilamarchaeum sp.]
MRFAILLMVFVLVFAGCSSQGKPPAQNQTPVPNEPPPKNDTPLSCSQYCITLPHTQCDGEWKISGTYPNCVCDFECKAQAPPPANNTTTEPPPVQEPEPLATPTSKSVSELMTDGIDRLKSDFYKANDGKFDEKTYTWLRQPAPQGGIVFDQAPYTDVTFDSKSITSIQASGFVVFDDTASTSKEAYGLAIFKAKSTPLDNYTGSDAFDVYYYPQMIDQKLRDCWTYTKDYNVNPASEWFVTYFFRCERAVAK